MPRTSAPVLAQPQTHSARLARIPIPTTVRTRPLLSTLVRSCPRWRQLRPLSPYTRTELARALLLAGAYEESAGQARAAIELAPERNKAYMVLRRALYMSGNALEAAEVPQKGLVLGAQVWPVCAYFRAGRREDALALLYTLMSTPAHGSGHVGSLAVVHACVGRREQAIQYLQQQFAMNQSGLAESLQAPELSWMRSDPRVAQLRKEIDLAP